MSTIPDMMLAKDEGLKRLRFEMLARLGDEVSKIDDNLITIIYQQGFIDATNFILKNLEPRLDKLEKTL